MKVINKTGFDIKIPVKGKYKIIPYDKKIIELSDSVYESYKDFFIFVEPPKQPKELSEEQIKKRNDRIDIEKKRLENRKKPLYYKKLKNKYLRCQPILLGERNSKWKWNSEKLKKRRKEWEFLKQKKD